MKEKHIHNVNNNRLKDANDIIINFVSYNEG